MNCPICGKIITTASCQCLSYKGSNTAGDMCWNINPCKNGHVFSWSDNSTVATQPPKGLACQCGSIIADGKGGAIDGR